MELNFQDFVIWNGLEEIYEEAVYLFTIDEERFYLVQNISRERLSEFTMENKNLSVMQNRSILHLPELPVIS